MSSVEKAQESKSPYQLLKAEDVAEILNISRAFVFILINRGELPYVRVGRLVRVKPSDLEAFISRSTTETTGSAPAAW